MELASLCDSLAYGNDVTGYDHLAQKFNVDPWSLDFYQIIFCIVERANLIKDLINKMPESSHVADDIKIHIDDLLVGFQPRSMNSSWNSIGSKHINAKNIQPIKMLSAFMRTKYSYPELDSEEISEVLDLVEELIDWLKKHQLSENDFIRESLISGLSSFHFRLDRLSWLGWAYTVASLRDVIGAYLALERGIPNSDPQAAAIIRKVGAGIKRIYEYVGVANDITDRADFLLKAYGLASLSIDTHSEVVKLLTFGN